MNLVPSHFRAQAPDHSPDLHVQPRAPSLPPPYHMPLVGDMRLKVPRVPRHEALDCTVQLAAVWLRSTDTRGWACTHVQERAPALLLCLLLRERMTAVIPGLMTVLYQIKEELASGRKREVSLRHLETYVFSLHILLNWLSSPTSHCHHGHHVTESNGLANPLDFVLRKVL